jgi:hypothetical protein
MIVVSVSRGGKAPRVFIVGRLIDVLDKESCAVRRSFGLWNECSILRVALPCQSNSYTVAPSAWRTLKGSAVRLRLSTTSMLSTTKYAALSLVTGLTCFPSFRQKTNEIQSSSLIAEHPGVKRVIFGPSNPLPQPKLKNSIAAKSDAPANHAQRAEHAARALADLQMRKRQAAPAPSADRDAEGAPT